MSLQMSLPAACSSELPEGVEIRPRKFVFDDLEAVPRDWFADNPILTHAENAFSILIPPGEQFFIRSVRAYQHRVADPEQQSLIRAFAQQEGLHTGAHDAFNASLFDAAMSIAGYPYLDDTSERRFAAYCAEDVMSAPVVSLAEIETVETLRRVLRTTNHSAFPVVDARTSRTERPSAQATTWPWKGTRFMNATNASWISSRPE